MTHRRCHSRQLVSFSSGMEKSVRRVEKLVHATNSALAQMKLSLMFDDASGERGSVRGGPRFLEDSGDRGDDLMQRQEEFRSEAKEVLSKMEKMFGSKEARRKTSNALNRIKEINRKMNNIRQEKVKSKGVEQSRHKLPSVTPWQKPLPCDNPRDRTLPPKSKSPPPPKRDVQCPLKKTDILPPAHSPAKSQEELKDKILETREVVNRGFQTARQLALKVDNIAKNERKEKMAGSEKAVREEKNGRSSGGGNESNGTADSVRSRRDQRREERVVEGPQGNTTMMDVRQGERRRDERPHLKLQRLPSVHIRGGLQLQKVHSLEIPATEDRGCSKANTGIHFLSHERLERTKMERTLEEMRRDNCYCFDGHTDISRSALESYVECSNCGKVMRVQVPKSAIDQSRVDDILRRCNFNVFDPRIDEFVEKFGTTETEAKMKVSEEAIEIKEKGSEEEKAKNGTKKTEKAKRDFSLEDLSNRLSNKYKEEANALEGTHLRLNNLLISLLRKMDESREVFEECHLFEREAVLTTAEPIFSLMRSSQGSGEKQKLDKKRLKNKNRNRTREQHCLLSHKANKKEVGEMTFFSETIRREKKLSRKEIERKPEVCERKRREVVEDKCPIPTSISSCQSPRPPRQSMLGKPDREEECKGEISGMVEMNKLGPHVIMSVEQSRPKEEIRVESNTSVRSSDDYRLEKCEKSTEVEPREECSVECGKVVTLGNEEKSLSETLSEKSDNNYASDFESTTNESGEEQEKEVAATATKLSTISEVDSEHEKKASDEQKIQRGSLGSKVPADGSQEDNLPVSHLANIDLIKRKRSSPLASQVSSLGRRAEDVSRKSSTPTELVTSLKDILSALKDQFARTETLAEKLTENAKQSGGERPEGIRSPCWVLEGLRSARSEGVLVDGVSGESGSSMGEVVEGRWSDKQSESESSVLKFCSSRRSSRREAKNAKGEEISYSEGEIPSDVLMYSECCSNYSLGEIR